jgi:protein SCO1/2
MTWLLLLALVVSSQGQTSFSNVLARVGIEQRLNATIPQEVSFRNEAGETIVLKDYLQRRPVVLAMVYYGCPQLCTEVLNGLTRSLRMISLDAGRDFDVITISIDPSETPALAAVKKETYIKSYGRSYTVKGWHCLTGNENAIQTVASSVGFHYYYDPVSKQYAHAAGIMILSPSGRITRYFLGIEYSPKDLEMALREADKGIIGKSVEQLLLLCFHYDPATGKYGPSIIRIMRLAGAGTVFSLGLLIGLMLRAERQRSKFLKA